MTGFYLFCRFWPGFKAKFPFDLVNHLSDEELPSALIELANEAARVAPNLCTDEGVERLFTAHRPPPPGLRHFFVIAVLADWVSPTGSWMYYAATGHRVLVTPRSPLLWLPDQETGRYVVDGLTREIKRLHLNLGSLLSRALQGEPHKELPADYVAGMLPHFDLFPADGGITGQVLVEGQIDDWRRWAGPNLAGLANDVFERVERIRAREGTRAEPDYSKLPPPSTATQQVIQDLLKKIAEDTRSIADNTAPATLLAGLRTIQNRGHSDVAHSPDFRSVQWFGQPHSFKASQAACVKVLWEAWENGTPEVGDPTILEAADVNSDLRIVFRDHPAWDTMIVQGMTKGAHRLQEPKKI